MKLSALYQIFLDCAVVTTDSRNCPAGSLFIALKGESFNGNAFAAQALKDGCAYAIVDEAEYAPENNRHIIWWTIACKPFSNWLIIIAANWVQK